MAERINFYAEHICIGKYQYKEEVNPDIDLTLYKMEFRARAAFTACGKFVDLDEIRCVNINVYSPFFDKSIDVDDFIECEDCLKSNLVQLKLLEKLS
jgi:hypothetical protein